MNELNEMSLSNSPLTARIMPRPRIDKILDSATRCKLVYMIAGTGYGKTQAVYHFIKQQQDAIVRWVQLTENDNTGSHYWESLTHNTSFDNPELADQLRDLGFPETLARFKQFAEILKMTEHRAQKTFLVLDDFHLIHSKQALTFTERCAHLNIPGACVIILSRKEPEINAISLFSKGKASIIKEDDLQFTDNELADFLRLCDIPFSAKELPRYITATKGWALAIQLLSLVLKRIPENHDLALDTMKQNVFKLLETEAWSDFPENIQKGLARLSLVSDLPFMPLHEISDDTEFSRKPPQLATFILFDSIFGGYKIHPLYLEFLQGKQFVLSDEEKQETYCHAAQWCSENKFYMAAMTYYAKSRQYEQMLALLRSYPLRLPYDACEHFLNIIGQLKPGQEQRGNQSVLLLKHLFVPLLLVGAGRPEEARDRSLDTIREWEHTDTPFGLYLLYVACGNLAYIETYACIVTHKYDFPKHLKKAIEHLKSTPMPPLEVTGVWAVADVRSFACLVGEGASLLEFDQFLEAARESAAYISETYHCMYYGYDDWAACELAFFRNQLDLAKNHAHNAILKAREKKQYSIEAMAEHYLLRIAMLQGNYASAKRILNQLQNHLDNPDFGNRQLLFDLIVGSFYSQIGLPALAPSWFVMNEKEAASEVHIPTREVIVSARYHIACKEYDQALAILCKSYPRKPQERFLFGELTLTLLTAIARINIGDAAGAMADFERAYELSFDGKFEMFFIEHRNHLRPLCAAALKQADCKIPAAWLKAIDRKASVCAKKADVIRNSIKRDRNMEDDISLSDRERDVLTDLYHGLSRDEIAANRYLSINTVKKIFQSIYIKLDANGSVDAIRIALETKLIE